MGVNDLAGGGDAGSYTPELLYAGSSDITTDAAPLIGTIDVDKYEIVVLTAAGIRKFIDADPDAIPDPIEGDVAASCVIAAQPVSGAGADCPYFSAGKFNHAALVWPASLDTYAKRKAFFQGTPIHIGKIS